MLDVTYYKEKIQGNLSKLQYLIERTSAIHLLIRNRIDVFYALSIPLVGNPIVKLQSRCIELEYLLRLQLENHQTYADLFTNPNLDVDQELKAQLRGLDDDTQVLSAKHQYIDRMVRSPEIEAQILGLAVEASK